MGEMLPKISVIIPVYNGERDLRQCLDSVVNQTLKDYEIICIDDKSSDNSVKILEKYIKKDKRIRIIKQKENMGVAYNRKIGIDQSKGEYVLFVDQDDWLRKDALEKLYINGSSNNSDIVFFDVCFYYQDTNKYTSIKTNDMSHFFDKDTDFNHKTFTYKDIRPHVLRRSFAPWYKLYKTSFMRKYDDFYFPKGIIFHDTPIHLQIILRAKKISFCPEKLYYYRLTSYNTTSTIMSRERGFNEIFNMVKVTEAVLKHEQKYKEFELDYIGFVLKFYRVRLDIFETNLKERFFSEIKNKIVEMNISEKISSKKSKEIIGLIEYEFYERVMTSKNYLEFFNKEKLENDEKELKYKKQIKQLNKNFSYVKKENNKNKKLIKYMKNSISWKITKPLRKLNQHRSKKRIIILGASHPLLLFLLKFNISKKDIFIVNAAIPENIAKNLNAIYFHETSNRKILRKNILKLRFNLFFKTLFMNKEVYGNDHLKFSFPFYENKNTYLLEDGLGNYELEKLPRIKKYKKNMGKFGKFKERFLYGNYNQFMRFGRKSNVKKIYLTGMAKIPKEISKKVEILNINKMWDKKTEPEKQSILDVYSVNKKTFSKINENTIIFLTQPFFENNILTLDEEIELYKKILVKYNPKDVLIKPHPREKKDYSKYLKDYNFIDCEFPSEFISLLNIKFKKAITINSSGILCFNKDKIEFLGTEIHPKLLKKYGKMTLSSLKNPKK